jgi:sec-independent protein translocase protein TatC
MAIVTRGQPGASGDTGDEGGRMSLVDHLRELRSRLFKASLGILVGVVVGIVFYQDILGWFIGPFRDTVGRIGAGEGIDPQINFDGIADPFTIPLRIALLSGVVVGAPVWIYQLWRFTVPGLHRHERRWAATVMVTAVPLFLGGVVLCYWLLPNALYVLLTVTPVGVSNIVSFNSYFSLVLRLILLFGVAFLLPVFIVLLNAVGVLTGESLGAARRWIVLGVFGFAAIATPTGDPITMLMLAIPMWLLFEGSVVLCRLNDRRRARLGLVPDYGRLSDDEASPTPLPSTFDEPAAPAETTGNAGPDAPGRDEP